MRIDSAGVGADGRDGHAHRDRDRGAAAGPAGRSRLVQRVPTSRTRSIARRAERELVQVGLADDDARPAFRAACRQRIGGDWIA